MDSTLTQTMFMRGEVQLGKGLQLLCRKVISIPVLRGEVQHVATGEDVTELYNFNSRTAWGSSTEKSFKKCKGETFQFPYCVGKFNLKKTISGLKSSYFNSRTAWGSSTIREIVIPHWQKISIPVLRGEVQPRVLQRANGGMQFQFPYCVGKFNYRHSKQRWPAKISIPVLRGEVQLVQFLPSQ